MVTAGVYLLARSWPLFEQAPATLTLVAWIGAFTALFGATIGLVQMNIKRVLAYSTISQLGYMFLAAGVGAYTASIFHLLTHAFFKALLFLAAGVAIHALHGEEDLRRMGGLRGPLPLAWAAFGIGGLAIAGFPPLSGFFSKDEIIWSAFVSERGNVVLGLIALVTSGLTAFYIFRAFFLAFYGSLESRAVGQSGSRAEDSSLSTQHSALDLHRPGPEMQIPLVALGILAIVGGWVLIPGVTDALEVFLEPVFAGLPIQVEHAGGVRYWLLAVVASLLGVAGIAFAYLAYVARPELSANLARRFAGAHRVLTNRYYVDELYDFAFVRPTQTLARWLSRFFDRGLDNGVNAVGYLMREASLALRELQTGYVRNYALLIFVGAILVIGFIVFGIGSGA
jgi:NADH-quinone oxidoreductase subunit L